MATINNGTFVVGDGVIGRVDLVVTAGVVPGVDGEVEGTKDHPVARVVHWEDGAPTSHKVAQPLEALVTIGPLDGDDHRGIDAAMLAARDHALYSEETHQPSSVDVTMPDVATAYARGLDGWPGPEVTTLTAEEWAVGRVKHLLAVAIGQASESNDLDLLHKDHPASTRHATEVVVDAAEVAEMIAKIERETAPDA